MLEEFSIVRVKTKASLIKSPRYSSFHQANMFSENDSRRRYLHQTFITHLKWFHLFQNEPGKIRPSPASKHGKQQ